MLLSGGLEFEELGHAHSGTENPSVDLTITNEVFNHKGVFSLLWLVI